jgi:hypothetical protein
VLLAVTGEDDFIKANMHQPNTRLPRDSYAPRDPCDVGFGEKMKDILIRGLIIALLVAILGDIASDILFAQRTEPYIITKEELSLDEKLTLNELSGKLEKQKVISGFEYVLTYPTTWVFWKFKLKMFAFRFCVILLSAVWAGYWGFRKEAQSKQIIVTEPDGTR